MFREYQRYRVNITVALAVLLILAAIAAFAADNDSRTETVTGSKTETVSGTSTSTSSSTSSSSSTGVSVTAPKANSTRWSNRSKDHKSNDKEHNYTYSTSKDNYRMVRGSGNTTTEKRSLSAFTGIVQETGVNLEIVIGPAVSAEVEIDDNLQEHLILEVVDGDLLISSEGSYSTHEEPTVHLTTPSLDFIRVDGSGEIDVSGLKGTDFTYELNGSGNLFLAGEVDMLEVALNGSGEVDTRDCKADEAFVSLNGSGTARVTATKLVDARLGGSGDIHVYGKPNRIHKSEDGSGNIFIH